MEEDPVALYFYKNAEVELYFTRLLEESGTYNIMPVRGSFAETEVEAAGDVVTATIAGAPQVVEYDERGNIHRWRYII